MIKFCAIFIAQTIWKERIFVRIKFQQLFATMVHKKISLIHELLIYFKSLVSSKTVKILLIRSLQVPKTKSLRLTLRSVTNKQSVRGPSSITTYVMM